MTLVRGVLRQLHSFQQKHQFNCRGETPPSRAKRPNTDRWYPGTKARRGGGIALRPEAWQKEGSSLPWHRPQSQDLFYTHCLAWPSPKPWGDRPREEGPHLIDKDVDNLGAKGSPQGHQGQRWGLRSLGHGNNHPGAPPLPHRSPAGNFSPPAPLHLTV